MRQDLYPEMRKIEENHWWFVARGKLVDGFLTGKKVLDVGCGTGGNMFRWKNKGFLVFGVDDSQTAVNYCRKRGLAKVTAGSAEKLPYDTGVFDLVTMLDVLEHVRDDKRALRECGRVLKPGGRALITVPAYSWMWSRWDEVVGHKRRYEVNEISKIIKGTGFIQNDVVCYFSFALVPVFIFRKIKMWFGLQDYKSDFREGNFGNKIFTEMASLERWLIRRGLRMPFGLSVMLVLIKK